MIRTLKMGLGSGIMKKAVSELPLVKLAFLVILTVDREGSRIGR